MCIFFNARNVYFSALKKDIESPRFYIKLIQRTSLDKTYLLAIATFFIFVVQQFSNKTHSLLKAADKFEQKTSEETFDEKLFVEFMKKVVIWEYFGITKQAYLAMSEQEKRDKISKYYSDMISRQSTGELFHFLFV